MSGEKNVSFTNPDLSLSVSILLFYLLVFYDRPENRRKKSKSLAYNEKIVRFGDNEVIYRKSKEEKLLSIKL